MYCVDRIVVKSSDEAYSYLEQTARQAKLLYNASLFRVRNHFTAMKKDVLSSNEQDVENEISLLPSKPGSVIGAYALEKLMVLTHNPDYYSGIPSQTAQSIVEQAVTDFRNWTKALKAWKKDPSAFLGKPKVPHYTKTELKGYTFKNQTAVIKDGRIVFPKTKLTLPCRARNGKLCEMKVTPYYGNFLVSVCYESPDVSVRTGAHAAAIDFGVDNIMTVTSDTGESILFKGGAVKSENRFFNKEKARLVSVMTKGHPAMKDPTSKRLEALSMHRSERMHDTFQKMSSRLIEWCVGHDIGMLVLSSNKGWKQNVGMGARNNQTFVSIPYYKLQWMLRYKAERAGIIVEEQEESYTSKASFLDNDRIPVYGEADSDATFSGRRIHRGLYKSKDGALINADINSAANILRKHGADTNGILLSNMQSPLVIRQPDLNKRIPARGIAAA